MPPPEARGRGAGGRVDPGPLEPSAVGENRTKSWRWASVPRPRPRYSKEQRDADLVVRSGSGRHDTHPACSRRHRRRRRGTTRRHRSGRPRATGARVPEPCPFGSQTTGTRPERTGPTGVEGDGRAPGSRPASRSLAPSHQVCPCAVINVDPRRSLPRPARGVRWQRHRRRNAAKGRRKFVVRSSFVQSRCSRRCWPRPECTSRRRRRHNAASRS